MNGFIEVTTQYNVPILINVSAIESVADNIIFTLVRNPQSAVVCGETYEEIKAKIDEAIKEREQNK